MPNLYSSHFHYFKIYLTPLRSSTVKITWVCTFLVQDFEATLGVPLCCDILASVTGSPISANGNTFVVGRCTCWLQPQVKVKLNPPKLVAQLCFILSHGIPFHELLLQHTVDILVAVFQWEILLFSSMLDLKRIRSPTTDSVCCRGHCTALCYNLRSQQQTNTRFPLVLCWVFSRSHWLATIWRQTWGYSYVITPCWYFLIIYSMWCIRVTTPWNGRWGDPSSLHRHLQSALSTLEGASRWSC